MAYTINRRLSTLVDSNGQLNTGKISNDYITGDHIADNVITAAMLHTSFTVSTSNLTAIDTDDVSEGSSNLYYTDARARGAVSATGSISYNSSTGVFSFTQGDTDTISEGSTNLYFTNERVDDRVNALLTAGTGITLTYDDGANTLTIAGAAQYGDSDVESYLDTNGLTLPDNVKAQFGASNDLEIYHDSSNSYIVDSGTGDLNIQATNLSIKNASGGSNYLRATTGGALLIYYSGAQKLATTSSGIDVTGAVVATSFSDGTISGITFIDEDSFATNSATRVPTQQSIKAYVDTQVAGVVDSAPAALDTLNELAAALGDDANFSTTTSTALGNRLRVDTAAQGLTGTQQANAITNLGITATKAELNYVDGVTSNIQTQLDGKQASGSYLTGNQTITLSGDVSGSGTTSIAVTIADDSHNHVISNVDGLQTALDAKLASSSYTAADVLTKIKTVDGAGSGLDADLLDGISSASFLRSNASDTASGDLTFTGFCTFDNDASPAVKIISDDFAEGLEIHRNHVTNAPGIKFTNTTGQLGILFANGSGVLQWRNLATTNSYSIWHDGNDGAGSGLDADLLDGQQGSYYAPASTALTTSTSFGGDVSGTYNAIVIANDSHTHTFDNLTGKQAGTGDYSTTGALVAGRGSGSIAMTINDGYGNSNLTFNHQSGTPDQNGNAARIEVNTDSSTNASMNFEVKSGVTGGTPAGLTTVLNLAEGVAAVTGNITVTGTVDGRDIASDGSKLDGIESGATADQTAAEILTAIKTVDGAGSGLDADLLDGLSEATFMRRSANSQLDMNNNDIVGVDQIIHEGDSNTYIQFHAADQWRVVTGASERLEANNTRTTVNNGYLQVTGSTSHLVATSTATAATTRIGLIATHQPAIVFDTSSTAVTGARRIYTIANMTGDRLRIGNPDFPETLAINNTGYVSTSGPMTVGDDLTVSGGNIFTDTSQQRVKLSVWSNTTYGIGMQAGYTFGGIASEYVLTNQMSNTNGRGFWWGDSGHTNAQGAMALTTQGYLTVANRIRVGYGESDTTTPSKDLDVSGEASIGSLMVGATTTPAMQLQVKDTTNYHGILVNGNAAPNVCFDRSTGTTAEWKVGISGNIGTSFAISKGTANDDKLLIDSSGNVGIGPTSPGAKLHVEGNILVNSGSPDLYLGTTSASHYNWRIAAQETTNKGFEISSGTQSSGSAAQNDTYTTRFVVLADTGETTITGTKMNVISSAEAVMGAQATGYSYWRVVADNSPNTYFQAGTGQTSSQVKMYFTGMFGSNNTMTVDTPNSRVGIGITSPGKKLDVRGTIRSTAANNDISLSDELPGYGANSYGNLKASANHIYLSIGNSYIGYINSSAQLNASDARLKENVATLTGALDKVNQLRGVSFNWIDSERGEGTHIGFIAQELEAVYPELVGDGDLPDDDDGQSAIKSVDYGHMVPVLVEAIKELKAENDALKARLDAGGL